MEELAGDDGRQGGHQAGDHIHCPGHGPRVALADLAAAAQAGPIDRSLPKKVSP